MSVSNLVAFERLFDRSAAVFLLALGAILAGAVVFIGG
jgi:hypothetical protein